MGDDGKVLTPLHAHDYCRGMLSLILSVPGHHMPGHECRTIIFQVPGGYRPAWPLHAPVNAARIG